MAIVDGNRLVATGSVLFLEKAAVDIKLALPLEFRRGDSRGYGADARIEDGNPVIVFDTNPGQEITATVRFVNMGMTYWLAYRITSRQVEAVVLHEAVYTVVTIS